MKITIITPTYNSADTIRDTIESVINQNYAELEYIVVDGLSTDNTRDIILEYKDRLNINLISEKDNGIYDAMNKGVKLAQGEIVGILNSDDFFHDNNVLSKINSVFGQDPNLDATYGDLIYVDRENKNKQTRFWKAGEFKERKINSGWIIPHPTFFIRNEVYKKVDKIFDTNFKIAADYELILRLLKVIKVKVKYIPEILVTMRDGGTSGRNIKQRNNGWSELKKAWTVNNLKVPFLFIPRRIISKLKQFI